MKRKPITEPLRPDTMFDPCIKCTICVTACPVAQITDKFPGPKQAGPDAQRFRTRGEPAEGDWINLCTGCLRCQVDCPAEVPIAEINLYAKQRYAARKGRDVATHMLSHAHLISPWGVRFRWLAGLMLRWRLSRWFAEKLFGIDRQAPMPPFAKKRFRDVARDYRAKPAKRKVAYFYGCFTDCNDPAVGHAVLKLLEAAGVEVMFPEQQCCGAALIGSGNFAAARKQNEVNIPALQQAVDAGCEAIIVGSPSCALALSREAHDLLELDGDEVFNRVIDPLGYLSRLDEAGELNLRFRETKLFAAFHEACHLAALGWGMSAVPWLRRIPGATVRVLDAGCCGLAGTYGLKRKTAPFARAIGQNVADRIAQWEPDVVVSECEGCRMQLTHLSGVPAKHPAQILADALEETDK